MASIGRAVALGFFDGVHIGHAALMNKLLDVRESTGLTPSVITFDTLPQNYFADYGIPLITSRDDRVDLITRMFGIDDIIMLPFNRETAETECSAFVDNLILNFNVRHLIAGQNFRFGKGAQGNYTFLQKICKANGLGCDIISNVTLNSIVSSSTYIRELLLAGDIETANAFLGHPHILTDTVRNGQKLGSTLGVPTINMHFAFGVLIPAYGVYATKVIINNPDNTSDINTCALTGVTNVGIRPTVSKSRKVTAETYIPDFDNNLYGKRVRLEFHKFIRPEKKFKNLEELKKQINKDCEDALDYFNNQEKDYN